jgi:hypothetical protein
MEMDYFIGKKKQYVIISIRPFDNYDTRAAFPNVAL